MIKKVLLVGPILSNSGYGEHSRCVLRTLIRNMEKFDIYIQPVQWGSTSTDTQDTPENKFILNCIKRAQSYKGTYDISLQVALPNEWKNLAAINIGITAAVETNRCNPEWIKSCNAVNKVITISEHAARSLTDHAYPMQDQEGNHVGVLQCQKPVKVVGYPVKTFQGSAFAQQLDISDVCFLNVAQFAPRKNVPTLIKNFVEEFKDENVGLLLKINMAGDSLLDRNHTYQAIKQVLDSVDSGKKRKCKIHILHGRLTEEELHSLYMDPRIRGYISTAHGEGFGLPIFEAAYSGLPVVAPNWSGYVDFLKAPVTNETSGKTKTRSLFLKTRFEIKPVRKEALMKDIIMEGAEWAYVDEKHFRKNLRALYQTPKTYQKEAKILQEYLLKEYSEDKIYDLMFQEIGETMPGFLLKETLEDNDFALFEENNG